MSKAREEAIEKVTSRLLESFEYDLQRARRLDNYPDLVQMQVADNTAIQAFFRSRAEDLLERAIYESAVYKLDDYL